MGKSTRLAPVFQRSSRMTDNTAVRPQGSLNL